MFYIEFALLWCYNIYNVLILIYVITILRIVIY